jgi:hypothetical protein
MPELPRRLIQEVIDMYHLEPGLVDIYVEGRSDKVVLDYLLDGRDVHVYEIDVIDVPITALEPLGLSAGARNRVIGLSVALNAELTPSSDYKIRCIVDADFDRLLKGDLPESAYQRLTDFSCLESYWFERSQLKKFRMLGLNDVGGLSSIDLYDVLLPVVTECFLLRASAAQLGLKLKWLDSVSCCSRAGVDIYFDRNEFITRWLNKNRVPKSRDAIEVAYENLRSSATGDARNYVHKDDFIGILAWYIRPLVSRVSQLANVDVVARTLACCVELRTLADYPLFGEILELSA